MLLPYRHTAQQVFLILFKFQTIHRLGGQPPESDQGGIKDNTGALTQISVTLPVSYNSDYSAFAACTGVTPVSVNTVSGAQIRIDKNQNVGGQTRWLSVGVQGQGGAPVTVNSPETITFPITFSNGDITALLTPWYSHTQAAGGYASIYNLNFSSLTLYKSTNGFGCCWIAMGH